jgi:hypothetical protein
VTLESFLAWKLKFDRELALKKSREEDEKTKSLTPKEREEWKRAGTRLSGWLSSFHFLFYTDQTIQGDNYLNVTAI